MFQPNNLTLHHACQARMANSPPRGQALTRNNSTCDTAKLMNRRHFCKIASLAVGALGINGASAFAAGRHDRRQTATQATVARRCRVTVLRRECHLDLQALFLDDPDSGPCELFRSGDDFTFQAGQNCPAGFCPRLWEMICSAMASDHKCAMPNDRSTVILSCPDGTRPVIVRVDSL